MRGEDLIHFMSGAFTSLVHSPNGVAIPHDSSTPLRTESLPRQYRMTMGRCSAWRLTTDRPLALDGQGMNGLRPLPYVPFLGLLLLWNAVPNGKRATLHYVTR